jgi:Tfp pilus assembly ATPase PilU
MSDIYDLTDLLQLIVAERAEGLTLQTGKPPAVELQGISHTVEGPALSPENTKTLLRDLVGTRQVREFRQRDSIEFVYTYQNNAEFQVEAKIDGEHVQIELRRLAV